MLVMGERKMTSGAAKIWIFGKVWEWLPLVWKMSGDLGGVFWSYGQPPSSHIIKNQKKYTRKYKKHIFTVFFMYMPGIQ